MKFLLMFFCLSMAFTSNSWSQNQLVVEGDPEEKSYIIATLTDGEILNGTFPAWCSNANIVIQTGQVHSYTFYSSLISEFPNGLIDKPENLDAVNWLINQKIVGATSPGGYGDYTFGDQQVAIWTLLDFTFSPDSSVEPYDQNRVNEIVSKALLKGEGFVPKCGQLVGIILDPRNANNEKAQTLIAAVPKRYFPKCVVPATGTK